MIRITDKNGQDLLTCHDDACIMVFEEGRGRLFTPEGLDAENPPDHAVLALAISSFARSPEGLHTIMAWFQKQVEEEAKNGQAG
jgi:hypothetical protein